MLSVNFFLRNAETNTNAEKQLVIYYQLEIEGQKRDTAQSTKIKIPHRFWWAFPKHKLENPSISKNGQPQYVIQEYFDSENINEQLSEIREAHRDIFRSMQTFSDEIPSYNELRKRYDPDTRTAKRRVIPKFLGLMSKMIEELTLERKWAKGTVKNHKIRANNIKQFFEEKSLEKCLIHEIKYKHIKELLRWMEVQTDKDNKPKFGQDTRNKHAVMIKMVLDYAVNEEFLEHSPISKLNLTYSEIKPPKYLDFQNRKKIASCNATSAQKIKDIAIFLMYTGFSYVDFLELNSDNLQGACWKKQRGKSSIYSLPPLLPEAAKIIEKYGSIEKIPRLHITDANRELKHLGDYCGLTKKTIGFDLTTSVFRETFASMMENEFMLPRSSIKFMMGHKNEMQLANYSTVQGGRLLHELEKHATSSENQILKQYTEFLQKFRSVA